jgi:RimJ/RimL family protein N-acetyltransferase
MQVNLANVTTDDLALFYQFQLDQQALDMVGFVARDWEKFTAHWAKILADDHLYKQTIQCDGVVVGHVVCFEMNDKWEIGYWLGREFWGQGIATQAVTLFLRQVSIRPLYAEVAKHNVGSLRVLQKNGFEIIGSDTWTHQKNNEPIEAILLKLN